MPYGDDPYDKNGILPDNDNAWKNKKNWTDAEKIQAAQEAFIRWMSSYEGGYLTHHDMDVGFSLRNGRCMYTREVHHGMWIGYMMEYLEHLGVEISNLRLILGESLEERAAGFLDQIWEVKYNDSRGIHKYFEAKEVDIPELERENVRGESYWRALHSCRLFLFL